MEMVAIDKKLVILPRNVKKYVKRDGKCPFDKWLEKQDQGAKAVIDAALDKVLAGTAVKVKSYDGRVGAIVLSFPKKLRIYYGIEDDDTIILLGGDERKQSDDINKAKEFWEEYIT